MKAVKTFNEFVNENYKLNEKKEKPQPYVLVVAKDVVDYIEKEFDRTGIMYDNRQKKTQFFVSANDSEISKKIVDTAKEEYGEDKVKVY
jgi:hypothetical protein